MFKLIRKIIVIVLLALLLSNLSSRAEAGLIKGSLKFGVVLPSDYWDGRKKMSHMEK